MVSLLRLQLFINGAKGLEMPNRSRQGTAAQGSASGSRTHGWCDINYVISVRHPTTF